MLSLTVSALMKNVGNLLMMTATLASVVDVVFCVRQLINNVCGSSHRQDKWKEFV